MSIIWKCLLVLSVICFEPSLYSMADIHAIVNGSLCDLWQIKITIFADNFNGIVLYCIDYEGSQVGIHVTQSVNIKNVRVNFNEQYKILYLKKLCDCDPCDERILHFDIQSGRGMLNISCNNHKSGILSWVKDTNIVKDENIYAHYPIPMVLVNKTREVYIMMGNIGPYVAKGNVTIHPRRDQMIGCVDTFYYNDKRILLIGDGQKLTTSCSGKCNNDSCNGGSCLRGIKYRITCDCSSAALNGRYCNQSMKAYNRGDNNSYKIMKDVSQIYLKMTWKQLLERRYCLMEIIGGLQRVILSINSKYLMIDNTNISNINIDGIHFITLHFTNEYLNIKTQNYKWKTVFSLRGETRINVGFSERNASCGIFEGVYDIHFDRSQIRIITESIVGDTETLKSNRIKNTVKIGNIQTLGILSVVCFVMLAVLVVIGIVLYLRNQREIIKKINKIEASSISPLDTTSQVFTETAIYSVTYDLDQYDYID